MSYSLEDAMSSILAAAAVCLESTPNGAPGSVFVYHTEPPADCGDILSIWLSQISPTIDFPAPMSRPLNCVGLMMMAEVKMKLVRNCWPVVVDNPTSPFPAPTEMNAAALDMTADARALWCCLVDGARDGSLWAGAPAVPPSLILESIRPNPPKGGLASVEVTMRLELD